MLWGLAVPRWASQVIIACVNDEKLILEAKILRSAAIPACSKIYFDLMSSALDLK